MATSMFSDNSDFWPTPRSVARGMLSELSDNCRYFLEPSGGCGNIADIIREPYTYEELECEWKAEQAAGHFKSDEYRNWSRGKSPGNRRVEVDVIESDPNFCHVLAGKGYPVIGYDWLSYNGVCYYDAILMNPPFSDGAAHLLKAWDFLYKGEIVCLLNAETIRNPYTESRKRLAGIIKQHNGRVTNLGKCFSTAERPTDVEVVQVYLKKNPPDDTFDLWATESTQENNPDVTEDGEPDFVAIRDNLENMVRWYEMANQHFIKGFEEIRRGMLYLKQNKISNYMGDDRSDYGDIVKSALDSSVGARADFLRKHRRDAWSSVFNQMQFHKWLDSKQQERMLRDVARNIHLPFTAEHIRGTLENVFLSRGKLFDESVANVFDELTSHHAGNTNIKSEGWKTNDSYKVNERLIFPRGCHYDITFHEFKMYSYYTGDCGHLYSDLDRILCVLDGEPFAECYTIGHALEHAFKLAGNLKGASSFYNEIDSQYFTGRFFKKGTVHLKWKRLDLLEAFNKTAANGKKWIGENTQQYRRQEKRCNRTCEHDGHNFENGACTRCEEPKVDPLSLIACEYCRAVADYTGRIECPLHPGNNPAFVPQKPNEQLSLIESRNAA